MRIDVEHQRQNRTPARSPETKATVIQTRAHLPSQAFAFIFFAISSTRTNAKLNIPILKGGIDMATAASTTAVSMEFDSHRLQHWEAEASQWHDDPAPLEAEAMALPPIDRGRKAYEFLAACFMLEALVWGLSAFVSSLTTNSNLQSADVKDLGFPFSYGVFQVHYRENPLFSSNLSGVAAIGTTQTGLMYFSAPFVAIVHQRWPQIRRPGMFVAAAVMVASLVGASFVILLMACWRRRA